MSDPIRVNVTARHIDQGNPCQPEGCAIQQALADAGFPNATVGPTTVWLDGYGGLQYAPLPQEAVLWRAHFDIGRPVQPFAFDLELRDVEGVHKHREAPCDCEPDDGPAPDGDPSCAHEWPPLETVGALRCFKCGADGDA